MILVQKNYQMQVGKQNIKVLGITDQGFRDAILSRKGSELIWPKNKMLSNQNQKILKRITGR